MIITSTMLFYGTVAACTLLGTGYALLSIDDNEIIKSNRGLHRIMVIFSNLLMSLAVGLAIQGFLTLSATPKTFIGLGVSGLIFVTLTSMYFIKPISKIFFRDKEINDYTKLYIRDMGEVLGWCFAGIIASWTYVIKHNDVVTHILDKYIGM